MSQLPSRIDLLELDIDLRLADLWREAAGISDWSLEVVAAFMRAAYGKGYCDALTEDSPGAGQCTSQRSLVIEIALDDVDALARQRRCPLAVRLARQAAQMKSGALKRVGDRTALIACHSGNKNRSIFCHA